MPTRRRRRLMPPLPRRQAGAEAVVAVAPRQALVGPKELISCSTISRAPKR
jgi:hypothetical protein